MLWCGLLLCLIAVAGGWRGGHRATIVPLAVALALALASCAGVLLEGHVIPSLLAGLAGAAAAVALAVGPAARVSADATTPTGAGVLRRRGMPLLLSVFLLPSLWFALTVAGPGGMSLEGLRDAPFSPAAETLLAALLLPATLVLAGIWPFGPVARGPRLAPLGALLLLVAVRPVLGEGLDHWRSLYAGWLVLGAFVAAGGADWPRLVACAGLFAIACDGESFAWAGTSLAVIASLLSVAPGMHRLLPRVALLAAAACGIAALGVTLGIEVVYSAAMVLATVIAILRTPFPAATAG